MANWRSRVWIQLSLELESLKLADWEECLTNNCCELRWLIWNYPIIAGSQSADCKTTRMAGRGFLSTPGLRGSFWRSCKVGLDRWCDKPGQTPWLSSNLQQAKPGAWMLPMFVLHLYGDEDKLLMCSWTWRMCFWLIHDLTLCETISWVIAMSLTAQIDIIASGQLGTTVNVTSVKSLQYSTGMQRCVITDFPPDGYKVLWFHGWDSWCSLRGSGCWLSETMPGISPSGRPQAMPRWHTHTHKKEWWGYYHGPFQLSTTSWSRHECVDTYACKHTAGPDRSSQS